MGKLVDWDEETNANKTKKTNASGVKWMKIRNGHKHVVRPVGKPVMFYRYTNKRDGRFCSIIVDDDMDNPIHQKYDITPSMRFAMNVFDREDGELKVYEFPSVVYNFLKQVKKLSKVEPGGKDGSDMSIYREVSGKKTDYELDTVEESPFTDKEKARVRAVKDENGNVVSGGLYDLSEIFKSTPEDKMEAYLYGKSSQEEASGSGSSAAAPSPSVPSVAPSVTPSADEDIDQDLGF